MKLLRLLPRFRNAYRAFDELSDRECWSREQIESFQLERLNRLWRHATRHVPHYRELQTQLMLPDSFRRLTDFQQLVPTLSKSQVRGNSPSFLSEVTQRGEWHRTGGATGTPMSCFWEGHAHREVLRARYRLYLQWGVDPLDRTAFLWGHEHLFEHGLRGHLGRVQQRLRDRIRGRLRLSAYHLGDADVRDHLRRLKRFRPIMLYGFSRAIHLLATEALGTDWHSESLRLVTLTSEVATPAMIATIERGFAAPAIVEYGASECHVIAGEWPDRTLRAREDVVLLETLPRDDGRFDLVITPLANTAFPLIRYRIGDVTDKPLIRPARGFAILHNVAGRNDDLLLTPSGRIIHPTFVDAIFEESIDPIRRYRVHQHDDGSLLATIELQPGTASSIETELYEQRLNRLIDGYPVHVQVVEQIDLTAAGKHRTVTSDMNPSTRERSLGPVPVEC